MSRLTLSGFVTDFRIGLLDIYFQINDPAQNQEALDLRDAVLRLRKGGAFVAVPLFRVNTFPIGPHPAGTRQDAQELKPIA